MDPVFDMLYLTMPTQYHVEIKFQGLSRLALCKYIMEYIPGEISHSHMHPFVGKPRLQIAALLLPLPEGKLCIIMGDIHIATDIQHRFRLDFAERLELTADRILNPHHLKKQKHIYIHYGYACLPSILLLPPPNTYPHTQHIPIEWNGTIAQCC